MTKKERTAPLPTEQEEAAAKDSISTNEREAALAPSEPTAAELELAQLKASYAKALEEKEIETAKRAHAESENAQLRGLLVKPASAEELTALVGAREAQEILSSRSFLEEAHSKAIAALPQARRAKVELQDISLLGECKYTLINRVNRDAPPYDVSFPLPATDAAKHQADFVKIRFVGGQARVPYVVAQHYREMNNPKYLVS